MKKESYEAIDQERLMPDDWHGSQEFEIHKKRYIFASQFVTNKVCLDVACGSGYGSVYLMSAGAQMVVGGDISRKCIEYGREHYTIDGLHFVRLDAQHLPFPKESFEVVVSLETIEHLKNPRQFLSECHRVLNPGGVFICSTPNKAITSPYTGTPTNPYHIKEFYVDELCALAEEYFQEIAVFGQIFINRDIFWRIGALKRYVGRLICRLPKGQSVVVFLSRLNHQLKYSKLKETKETGLATSKTDVVPLPENDDVPAVIVLLARKVRGNEDK